MACTESAQRLASVQVMYMRLKGQFTQLIFSFLFRKEFKPPKLSYQMQVKIEQNIYKTIIKCYHVIIKLRYSFISRIKKS